MALSLAAVQPPVALYREDQRFGWWIYAVLALMISLEWSMLLGFGAAHPALAPARSMAGSGVGMAAGLGLPILLLIGVLRMTTVVAPGEVRVWFGWLPTYRRAVPLGAIQGIEIIQYRPLRDYGGWGIRMGRDGEKALNARGNRGVRLTLHDGSRLMIGSQRAEDLARAIEAARPSGL